jgi:hypothetical protein
MSVGKYNWSKGGREVYRRGGGREPIEGGRERRRGGGGLPTVLPPPCSCNLANARTTSPFTFFAPLSMQVWQSETCIDKGCCHGGFMAASLDLLCNESTSTLNFLRHPWSMVAPEHTLYYESTQPLITKGVPNEVLELGAGIYDEGCAGIGYTPPKKG